MVSNQELKLNTNQMKMKITIEFKYPTDIFQVIKVDIEGG